MANSLPSPRRNLERKSRCSDLSAAAVAVERLGARRQGVLEQTDVYYRVTQGRLKLRMTVGQPAMLIWYERPDESKARWSRYYLAPISDPAALGAALSAALGECGEVSKRRTLWLWHNVRIHLDEVAGLGTFVELEAVMSGSDDEATAKARLSELSAALQLTPADEVAASYADLLAARSKALKAQATRTETAIADTNEALRLDPANAEVFDKRGSLHFNLKHYKEAVADFTETIRLDPNQSVYYLHRGFAHEALGRKDEASEDYRRAKGPDKERD